MWLVLCYKPLQAVVHLGYQFLLSFSSFKSLHTELCEFTVLEGCEAEVFCSRSNGEDSDRGDRQHKRVLGRRGMGEATAAERKPTFARFVRATHTSSSRLRMGA